MELPRGFYVRIWFTSVMSASIGILLSLFGAVFKAGKEITVKSGAIVSNEYTTGWAYRFFSVFVFAAVLFVWQSEIIITDMSVFAGSLIVASVLFTITTLLTTRALKISDISIVGPVLALIPVVTSVPAWILLGQEPSLGGWLGLILVSIGVYVLQIHSVSEGLLEPIKLIAYDKGAQYAVLALVFISVIPSIDKIGIDASTPILWVFSTHLTMSVWLFVIMLWYDSDWTHTVSDNLRVFLAIAGFNSVLWVAQAYAYTYLPVAYVQGIKRASIILLVLAGYLWFDESHLRNRIIGALITFLGVLCIIFFG